MELSSLVGIIFTFFLASTRGLSYPTPVDFDGKLLRWNITQEESVVTYEVQWDGNIDEYYSYLIDASAEIWSDVPTSLIELEKLETHAQITIRVSTPGGTNKGSFGHATFDEKDDSGPKHCQIEIFATFQISPISFAKTVLHEIGHCLGLGHSLIPESIMSYELDENRFGLDVDDQAAISRLYPSDGSQAQLPLGCAISIKRGEANLPVAIFLMLASLCFPIIRGKARC